MAGTSSDAHSDGSSSSSFSASSRAGIESAANDTTRNFILGLPKSGPVPGSSDAASLQAAEAFMGEIQQEIMAYDIANARAMEAYAQSWWAKVPYFGKRWTMDSTGMASTPSPLGNHSPNTHIADGNSQKNVGSDVGIGATASTVVASAGGMRDHVRVERTSAVDNLPNGSKLQMQRQQQQQQIKMSSWLFKQRHPGWVPLIQRGWVPVVCAVGIVMIWTPDVWKLRTLYWCDHKYALFRQSIHKAYWRATMSAEDYAVFMEDIEHQRPTSVKVSNCPV